jgi:putative toxin-antitoxin system antitoxin component (TIGR02293 family)
MKSNITQILDEAPSDVIRRTRRGFPVAAIHEVAVVLDISEQKLCDALRIRKRRTVRNRSLGGRLTADESDTLLRVLKALTRATNVLADEESSRQWLCRDVRSLGGVEPLSLLDTGVGYSFVMDTLGRIEHGIVA